MMLIKLMMMVQFESKGSERETRKEGERKSEHLLSETWVDVAAHARGRETSVKTEKAIKSQSPRSARRCPRAGPRLAMSGARLRGGRLSVENERSPGQSEPNFKKGKGRRVIISMIHHSHGITRSASERLHDYIRDPCFFVNRGW